MTSAAWQARRKRWLQAWMTVHGTEPTCLACGGRWSLNQGELHHRSYDRLGHEADDDLISLHRTCHIQLHHILDSNPAWRRAGRQQATDVIVARLRRANREK